MTLATCRWENNGSAMLVIFCHLRSWNCLPTLPFPFVEQADSEAIALEQLTANAGMGQKYLHGHNVVRQAPKPPWMRSCSHDILSELKWMTVTACQTNVDDPFPCDHDEQLAAVLANTWFLHLVSSIADRWMVLFALLDHGQTPIPGSPRPACVNRRHAGDRRLRKATQLDPPQ